MILGAGLIALLALQYGLERPWVRHRWLVWPAFGLLGASVVDTGSAGGQAGLGLGAVVFSIGRARSTWVRVRKAAVTALAIGVLVYATYPNSLMRARFAEALTRGALAGRERIYPALMHMAAERPLVGWGPVNNKDELGIRFAERIHHPRDRHHLLPRAL